MDKISALKKLKGLLEQGIITEEEFIRQKGLILGEISKPKEDAVVPPSSEDTNTPLPPTVDSEQEDIPQIVHYPNPVSVPSEEEHGKTDNQVEDNHIELATETQVNPEEERIKKHKALLGLGIFICVIGIIGGIVSLFNDNIADRIAKYEKAGMAILTVQENGTEQYAIVMDKQGLYYDDKFKLTTLLPVGEEIETKVIRLQCDADGLRATTDEAKENLVITSSRNLYVICNSPTSFLLLTKKASGNPLTDRNISLGPGYLIINKDKSKSTTVIKYPECQTDGYGNIYWRTDANILDQYGAYFKSVFTNSDYNKIVKREYGHYLATVQLSLSDGEVEVLDAIKFDKLDRTYSPAEVGTLAHSASMRTIIREILRSELVESFYKNAEAATDYHNRSNMRISPDDKYTFVIVPHYYTGREHVAVYKVNNNTKVATILNSGMEAEYLSERIRIKKYKEFWFFDSYEYVYYDYSGKQIKDSW